MTVLAWDEVGTRTYEYGLDHGVLYIPDGDAIPWNGLISVSEKPDGGDLTSHYIDGQKYADLLTNENYKATIEAVTYPDEFERFNGILPVTLGMMATAQPRDRFGLSYRTTIGNDLTEDLGYKIHLVYNLTALPVSGSYNSLSNIAEPTHFSWDIVAVPVAIDGMRPTAHIILDPRDYPEEAISSVETAIYGSESVDAYLPTPTQLLDILSDFWLVVIDNGNGTWTATGPELHFDVLTADEFSIDAQSVTYIDADTYLLGSTDD